MAYNIKRWHILLASGGIAVAGTAFIAEQEGERGTAYRDINGTPTICEGRIQGVHMGMTATHEECVAWFTPEVQRRIDFVKRILVRPQPPLRVIALGSFAFNEGNDALLRSSALQLINRGQIAEGCRALLRWDGIRVWSKALHRKVFQYNAGLHGRRLREVALCLDGLT